MGFERRRNKTNNKGKNKKRKRTIHTFILIRDFAKAQPHLICLDYF